MALLAAAFLNGCRLDPRSVADAFERVWSDRASLSEADAATFVRIENAFLRRAPRDAVRDYVDNVHAAFSHLIQDYARPVSPEELADRAVRGIEAAPDGSSYRELMDLAIRSMAEELDPHTAYLDEDEYRELRVSTRGVFGGIGIEITRAENAILVVSPIEGTPAFRAGVKPEDRIVAVDGQSVRTMGLLEAVRLMRGEPGTDVTLSVERGGERPFEVTLTRAVINVRPVRWHREGRFGYLRLTTFVRSAEAELMRAWSDLAAGGPVEGIILDLRNNPGGLLNQSVAVADAFLDQGLIVASEGRDPRTRQTYEADPVLIGAGVPLVALINEGTASAAEIVAAALKNSGRAVVLGRRSFGKGTVQTIISLPFGGGLRLTTALYRAPGGDLIQGRGVLPDIVIRDGSDDRARREENLPGTLRVEEGEERPEGPAVSESACPLPAQGNDRMIGCAVTFLSSGNVERFLRRLAVP